jgi:hypothetical protein
MGTENKMYNAFEKTHKFQGKTAKDSSATAGMGKVSGRGLKGREELKALGERNGWAVREVSMREIQQMSADETLWHEAFNKENFDLAFTLAENGRLNAERMPVWNARRMWEGKATPDENERARIAGDAFATRTPQFARTLEAAQIMARYMEQHDLDATKIESYSAAFTALVEDGKFLAQPSRASRAENASDDSRTSSARAKHGGAFCRSIGGYK